MMVGGGGGGGGGGYPEWHFYIYIYKSGQNCEFQYFGAVFRKMIFFFFFWGGGGGGGMKILWIFWGVITKLDYI